MEGRGGLADGLGRQARDADLHVSRGRGRVQEQQILDALLPLYMNGTVLRALQESLASEPLLEHLMNSRLACWINRR